MVLRIEFPQDAKISKGRFLLFIKNEGTDNQKRKQRFVRKVVAP